MVWVDVDNSKNDAYMCHLLEIQNVKHFKHFVMVKQKLFYLQDVDNSKNDAHMCHLLEIQNVEHLVMVKQKLFYLQGNKSCK